MPFLRQQVRQVQQEADDRAQSDANTQRNLLVVDIDGEWLMKEIDSLGNANRMAGVPQDRRFNFLGEDEEALLGRLSSHESGTLIEISSGGMIRRLKGHNLDTWVFRVDNGYFGRDGIYFDLAYRRIETGDHLPYLKHYRPSRG